jgi:hypothetical protein
MEGNYHLSVNQNIAGPFLVWELRLGGQGFLSKEASKNWVARYVEYNFLTKIKSQRTSTDLLTLKVHKHEIIWNFFLTQIKSLYSLGKFSNKISLLFLRFSPEFRSSNIFAVTEHTRNQIFLERYPNIFFFKMFTWVLLDGFLNGFSKFGFFMVEICILMWDF